MSVRRQPELRREDFQNALNDIDTFVDVTIDDLMHINRMASKHAQMRKAEAMLVSEVMTSKVLTVRTDTLLRDAASVLLERRISGLPVVDDRDRLVGIVTEADFLCAMGIPCHHPAHNLWQSLEAMFRHPPGNDEQPTYVADIMVTGVVSITGDRTLHDAIDTMKKHHIKRLVVIDEQRKVQGIVTRSNLVQVLLQQIL